MDKVRVGEFISGLVGRVSKPLGQAQALLITINYHLVLPNNKLKS